jgi:predicted O-methyltransferase YrrM
MNHFSEGLDGWFDFHGAYDRIVARLPADRPSTVVEVGVWLGCSAAYLGVEVVNSAKPITVVAVDSFKGSPDLLTKLALPTLEAACRVNLAPLVEALGGRFRLLAVDSVDAAATFDDGAVDAVWIDASHEYEDVRDDIAAWWPKLRADGVMAGHDIGEAGVRRAVEDRFGAAVIVASFDSGWWWVEKAEAA